MNTFFTKLRLFFHAVSFIINVFTFTQDVLGRSLKALCSRVSALVFQQVVVRKTASSESIFRGSKDGSWRVINRYCREDEEEQIYSAELYG
jgi:hypothetical protein